jgi:serine/threonine protein kinase
VSAELSDGQSFGGYHIVELVGSGGMGLVYRAGQRILGRTVALKVIRPEIADSGGYRERFLREARFAAAVDDPHVVSVFDAGEQDGRLYLAMQWVDGLDLGIAKAPAAPDSLTRTGSVIGTPGYLSPEQIRGQQPGPRSDLYALGCVMFEALTGQRPFGGDDRCGSRRSRAHRLRASFRWAMTEYPISEPAERCLLTPWCRGAHPPGQAADEDARQGIRHDDPVRRPGCLTR